MGVCSTHRSDTGDTGVDALRLLFEVDRVPLGGRSPFQAGEWNGGLIPSHSLVWMERKGGNHGVLWSPGDVQALGVEARSIVDSTFGVRKDRGVSRADFTTTRTFVTPEQGRAFMGGMAAMEFPRLEASRRGTPPHSVWWTGAKSRKIRNRVYDKSRERGGEPWMAIRLEDQRSFPGGSRPSLETVADAGFQRERFLARFEPMRKAVTGVKAATFPVVAQALADEFRYGYRTWQEVERLAGSLVILGGGAAPGELSDKNRRTFYRRKSELREAGYVVLDDFMEPVEVDLGAELDAALEEFSA